MATEVTKTQIDRLGERLKKGNVNEADLRLLDEYRYSFAQAYEIVVGTIQEQLLLRPTGRPEKSTTSIIREVAEREYPLNEDLRYCMLQGYRTRHRVPRGDYSISQESF